MVRLGCFQAKYQISEGNLLVNLKPMIKFLYFKSGYYRMTNYDLSNHYEDDLVKIEKFRYGKTYSAVYFDGEKNSFSLNDLNWKNRKKIRCLYLKKMAHIWFAFLKTNIPI